LEAALYALGDLRAFEDLKLLFDLTFFWRGDTIAEPFLFSEAALDSLGDLNIFEDLKLLLDSPFFFRNLSVKGWL
jgi:hypothetical protein